MLLPLCMEVKSLHLDEVLTYAYCSMQYHLRFRLGLPWTATSPETAVSLVVRETIREYLRLQMSPGGRQMAGKSSIGVLDSGLKKVSETFPGSGQIVARAKGEMLLSFRALEKYYVFPKDFVLGFDVPTEVSITDEGKPILVQGNLDAVIMRNHQTLVPTALVLSVISTWDPFEDTSYMGSVRAGFSRMAVRNTYGLQPSVLVQHQTFPVKKTVALDRLSRSNHMDFRKLVIQAWKGIHSGSAIPVGIAQRCVHCPFRTVCSVGAAFETKADIEMQTAVASVPSMRNWPS